MENGLPSPTSIMKGGQDLNESIKNDCFSPIDVFSPAAAPVPGKNNPFSSSSSDHLLVASQSATVSVNPLPSVELSDARRNSHSRRPEVVVVEGLKPNVGSGSGSHWKPETPTASSVLHRPSPSPPTNWHINTSSPPVQSGSHHLGGWEGTSNGPGNHHTNSMDWESSPRQGGSTFSRNGSVGPGSANNQTRHSSGSGSRYSSPRDRDRERERDQGHSGSSRSRSSWSGRPSYSGGGGGGHRQQTKSGQRVCKFYESGYCKKGASCSYLHP